MKWQITLKQPWYAFKVRATVEVRFGPDEVFVISEYNLYQDRIFDLNEKDEASKGNILTVRDFFPEGKECVLFDDWSQAHEFKAKLDGILAKLHGRLQKLIPEPQPAPEPEPVAPELSERDWQRHAVLMSNSGSGKTNAMRWRMLQVLDEVEAGRASMVLMEPKGTLTKQILGLRRLYDLRDRVVVIDPEDIAHPVSVNLFDRGVGTERDINAALGMTRYVLDTMTAELSGNHRQVLEAVTQLMFVLPEEPWMGTLLETLLNGAQAHRRHFGRLNRATRSFFENHFEGDRGQTHNRRLELLNRLNSLLGQTAFDRLLYQRKTTFSMLDAMNRGSIILINANEDYFGADGELTALYGKFWTAQIFKAGMSRMRLLSEGKKLNSVWVFIDEAQEYISEDTMFARSLNLLREAKVSNCFAMHYLSQIRRVEVKDAIDINTSVKFAAIPQTDFVFQCEAPAFSGKVRFPPTDFAAMPQMSVAQRAEVLDLSRKRYTYTSEDEPEEPQRATADKNRPEYESAPRQEEQARGDFGPL